VIINQFTAENVLNIRAVSISPDPDNPAVLLTGPNGAGKTSILDAIELAIAGGKAFDNGKAKKVRALRDGENHGEVTIAFGEYVVTRTWDRKADGSIATAMILTGAKGYQIKKPQTILDGFLGKLSFDPLSFATMTPKDQQATLVELVDLGFDPVKLEADKARLAAERTAVGRVRDQLNGEAAGYPVAPAGTPIEEQSASDLIDEHRRAAESNRRVRELGTSYQQRAQQVAYLVDKIAQLTAELTTAESDLERAAAEVNAAPALIDEAPILARLDNVEATNSLVRSEQNRLAAVAKAEKATADYKALTAAIAALDDTRAKALAGIKFPSEGLGFDDEGVTLNGVPFASAATGDQLVAGTELGFALNPDLRVVRISRGESLDAEHLRIVAEVAAKHDGQLWLERVDESGQIGVVIREGRVVSTPESRAAAADA
jgi:hypothetical protein